MLLFAVEGSVLKLIHRKYIRRIIYLLLLNDILLIIWFLYNIFNWSSISDFEANGGVSIRRTVIISTLIEIILFICLCFAYWKYTLEQKIMHFKKYYNNSNKLTNTSSDDIQQNNILRAKKRIENNSEEIEESEEEEEQEGKKDNLRGKFFKERTTHQGGKIDIRDVDSEREP